MIILFQFILFKKQNLQHISFTLQQSYQQRNMKSESSSKYPNQQLIQDSYKYEQANENDDQNIIDQQEVRNKPRVHNDLYPQFIQMYQFSLNKMNQYTIEKIQQWINNRQLSNYLYFVKPEEFVEEKRKDRLIYFNEVNRELVMNFMLQKIRSKEEAVQRQIQNGQLKIQRNNFLKQKKQDKSKQKSKQKQVLNHNLSSNNQIFPHSQQSKSQYIHYKQILSSYRKEKLRLQKLKQHQIQHKKQKEQSLKQQQKQNKQEMKKYHSQLINKKIMKNKEKREKNCNERVQRNNDYRYIVKQWAKNDVLHNKMQRQFQKRYDSLLQEDRKKFQSQRQKYSLNARVQELKIEEHKDKYLKWKSQNQAIRAAKIQEQQRMVKMYEKQLKRYKGFSKQKKENKINHDDNDDQDNSQQQDSQTQNYLPSYSKQAQSLSYMNSKKQKHNIALEKRQKMSTYWQSFVKQQYQPKIDNKKREQLQKMIESLHSGKKFKKIKNQKGEIVLQELKLVNPALKGIEYLSYARELGRIRKENSKNAKDQMEDGKSSVHQQTNQKRRSIDYLKQLRESRTQSLNGSGYKNSLSFLERSEMSFNQKLERVQRESFKLQQMTKQSQNQLKYGKFKTSQQILQYKGDIDSNHVEILRMKLRLANEGMGRNGSVGKK